MRLTTEEDVMEKRFKISIAVENGRPHYKVLDYKTGKTVHCDLNELNETTCEMRGE